MVSFIPFTKYLVPYYVPCMILKTGDIIMGVGEEHSSFYSHGDNGENGDNMILVTLTVASKKVCSCPNSWNR